jgi:hypothetical protein
MTMDRQARIDAMLDKQDIYECLVRISRGSDRGDKQLFLSAFHDDAVVAAGPFVGGPSELYDWSAELQVKNYTATFHKLHQQSCDLDGDTAHAEAYYLYVACMATGINLIAGGRYIDRFEKRGGVWGLVTRNNFVEWTSTLPALGNPLGAIADLELNGLPASNRSDPSYTRPLVNKRAINIPG